MQELNMTTIMMTFNMGNQREYLSSGGFLQYLYVDHESFSPLTINGIRGKVVHYIPDGNTDHTGLPTYADTSDMYFRVDKNGNVIQGKVYIDRKQSIDFDWGHTHVNKKGDGKIFPEGVVHVQIYNVDKDGNFTRNSNNARYMNDDEIAKYGPLIQAFNPNVKFKP